MGNLAFTYGVMGSSKSAQALITRHNYIQKGFNVILCKPEIDNRGDTNEERTVSSRIGIEAKCLVFNKYENLIFLFLHKKSICYINPNFVFLSGMNFRKVIFFPRPEKSRFSLPRLALSFKG